MEQIGQNYGFILYQTVIPLSGSAVNISIPGLRDRGIVFVNQVCEMLDRFFDFHVSESILKAEPFRERSPHLTSIIGLSMRNLPPGGGLGTPKHFGHRCHISFWTATFTRRKLGVLWRKMARTMPNMCRAVPIF